MVDVARVLATDVVAATSDLSPQKFAKADRELAVAEAAATSELASKAIDEFRKAWETAT